MILKGIPWFLQAKLAEELTQPHRRGHAHRGIWPRASTLKRQFNLRRGRRNWLHPHEVPGQCPAGTRPWETTKKSTVDGWDREDEVEERWEPRTATNWNACTRLSETHFPPFFRALVKDQVVLLTGAGRAFWPCQGPRHQARVRGLGCPLFWTCPAGRAVPVRARHLRRGRGLRPYSSGAVLQKMIPQANAARQDEIAHIPSGPRGWTAPGEGSDLPVLVHKRVSCLTATMDSLRALPSCIFSWIFLSALRSAMARMMPSGGEDHIPVDADHF